MLQFFALYGQREEVLMFVLLIETKLSKFVAQNEKNAAFLQLDENQSGPGHSNMNTWPFGRNKFKLCQISSIMESLSILPTQTTSSFMVKDYATFL